MNLPESVLPHITQHTTLERIEVVCPAELFDGILADLGRGWRLTRTEPYTDRQMWPEVDVSRALFVAEREVDEEEAERCTVTIGRY